MEAIVNKTDYSGIFQEIRLLSLLSVRDLCEEQRISLKSIGVEAIDWNSFYRRTRKNRVFPIVYKNCYQAERYIIPKAILEKIAVDCKFNSLYALQMTSELIKIVRDMRRRHIPVIAIKGPLLSMSIYQDISLRASRDLDLLTDVSKLRQIDEYLTSSGYEAACSFREMTMKQDSYYRKTFHHITYHNQSGLELELHWRLLPSSDDFIFRELWKTKKKYRMFTDQVYCLEDEDNLIYLILHGSMHAYKRLRWVCDIYEFMKSNQLDWNYIINRLKTLGKLHLFGQIKLLMEKLFLYQPNIELLLSKRDRVLAGHLADMALLFLGSCDETPEQYGHELYFEYKLYMLLWNRTFRERMSYLRELFIPGIQEFQKVNMKDHYFDFYYVLRTLQIVRRCSGYAVAKLHKIMRQGGSTG